jgi:hypothetical protein
MLGGKFKGTNLLSVITLSSWMLEITSFSRVLTSLWELGILLAFIRKWQ